MDSRVDRRWAVGSIPAAVLLFASIAGVALVGAATAWAGPGRVSWHAVEAPMEVVSLSDYLLQPPEGGTPKGEVSKEDTTEEVPSTEPLNPPVPPPSLPHNPPPGFGATDTTGRHDSLMTFPSTQFAPIETIGGASSKPIASGATSKRGILGLHPAALIAALIALHIVVVGLIAK